MTAPTRDPFYYELLSNGEVSLDPTKAMGWLIDDVASTVATFPEWIVEDTGHTVDLKIAEHVRGERLVIFWRTAPVDGTITLRTDPSGWVRVTGTIDGREVLAAWLDRPWEQFELWPEDSTPARDEEAPGQIGKKLHWIGLNAELWPALLPIAGAHGGVMLAVDDVRLSARMNRNWTQSS